LLSTNQAVILYGHCASGKSTCYKTLARALCQFHSPWSLQADATGSTTPHSENSNFARVNLKVVYPNALSDEEVNNDVFNLLLMNHIPQWAESPKKAVCRSVFLTT